VPLTGLERGWQRLIGYVPQDTYLLDETLRRNIAFAVPDALIDEQRVARACTLAQLDDLIRQLPLGMDTPLGEDGARLSGGQRQRVAIARALYSDPAVLVFDEATAALDNQTEREVTKAIASLHGTRTLIVTASARWTPAIGSSSCRRDGSRRRAPTMTCCATPPSERWRCARHLQRPES
jgi:ABC-type bacteriocin/lantibiotic exporter with double-glycine peptidase domain